MFWRSRRFRIYSFRLWTCRRSRTPSRIRATARVPTAHPPPTTTAATTVIRTGPLRTTMAHRRQARAPSHAKAFRRAPALAASRPIATLRREQMQRRRLHSCSRLRAVARSRRSGLALRCQCWTRALHSRTRTSAARSKRRTSRSPRRRASSRISDSDSRFPSLRSAATREIVCFHQSIQILVCR